MTGARPLSRIVAMAGVAAFLLASAPAHGDGAVAVSEERGRSVAAELTKAWRDDDPLKRAQAAEAAGPVDHPRVGQVLLARLKKEPDADAQASILRALRTQTSSREAVIERVRAYVRVAAEAQRERTARGDTGLKIDPRTGDVDLTSPEGSALAARRGAEAVAVLDAIGTLTALSPELGAEPAAWIPLLGSGNDALVAAVLGALGKAKVWAALPSMADLYDMYPTADSWETGAVVDLGGTNATAKAKWMVRFGDPGKRRARPAVHEALLGALTAMCGETFATPEQFRVFLARQDALRRIEGKAR